MPLGDGVFRRVWRQHRRSLLLAAALVGTTAAVAAVVAVLFLKTNGNHRRRGPSRPSSLAWVALRSADMTPQGVPAPTLQKLSAATV